MAQMHPLFPQPIYQSRLEGHSSYKENLIPKITKQYQDNINFKQTWGKESNSWSMRADEKAFILIDEVKQKISEWFDYFNYGLINYLIEPWFNVHTSEMYQETHNHIGHVHGFIFLCGIYYLQLDSAKDNSVVFVNNADNYLHRLNTHGLPVKHGYYEQNTLNLLDIKEGDILLFNPDQPHFVPAAKCKHDGLRISLSFNVSAPFELK